MSNVEKLHTILLSYTKESEHITYCNEQLLKMKNDGLSDRQIEMQIVMTLYDGLHYGNWPWAPTRLV